MNKILKSISLLLFLMIFSVNGSEVSNSEKADSSSSFLESYMKYSKKWLEENYNKMINDEPFELNWLPDGTDIEKLKEALIAFKKTDGVTQSITSPIKLLFDYEECRSLNYLGQMQGSIYELLVALELQKKGQNILSFAKYYNYNDSSVEFDIITDKYFIECKKVDGQANKIKIFNDSGNSIFIKNLLMRNEIAKKENKLLLLIVSQDGFSDDTKSLLKNNDIEFMVMDFNVGATEDEKKYKNILNAEYKKLLEGEDFSLDWIKTAMNKVDLKEALIEFKDIPGSKESINSPISNIFNGVKISSESQIYTLLVAKKFKEDGNQVIKFINKNLFYTDKYLVECKYAHRIDRPLGANFCYGSYMKKYFQKSIDDAKELNKEYVLCYSYKLPSDVEKYLKKKQECRSLRIKRSENITTIHN